MRIERINGKLCPAPFSSPLHPPEMPSSLVLAMSILSGALFFSRKVDIRAMGGVLTHF